MTTAVTPTSTDRSASALVAGSWTIDPTHSEVGFTVRHLMTKVRGQFTKFEGTITTGESLSDARATATIDLASVDTREQNRDGHLRSADFFDVENHPTMTFATTSFDGEVARGELTIKGITKPVELDVEFLGLEKDGYGNPVVGFDATAEVNRKDWDLTWQMPLDGGRLLVGEKVTLVLSVQARLDA